MSQTAAAELTNIPDISAPENNIHAGAKVVRSIQGRYFKDAGLDPISKASITFAGYNTGPMRTIFKFALAVLIGASPYQMLCAQDLAPRAYIITPVHWNAVTLTYSFLDGDVLFNNTIPIANATATIHVSVFSYYHSLSFFGRSANILASLPYGVGNFKGQVGGGGQMVYRSGLVDSTFRFSVNLLGGPAMSVKGFQSWQQKTVLGVSLKVVAPTGQYDGTKLINNGSNRWAFKPELGYSRRWGHWVLDAYGAVWFFTTNPEFFSHNASVPGTQSQSQKPIGAFEGHLSYDVKPRLWFSLDGNSWFGGRTSLNSIQNAQTLQVSSLIGATASVPLSKHQSLKVSYSDTDYARFGGHYHNVSVAWQYSWLGRPN
jgi:Putative MetA-pathway of phenol degradation